MVHQVEYKHTDDPRFIVGLVLLNL